MAAGWLHRAGGGVDGVIVKAPDGPYEPGSRAMVKVKPEHPADCVVAGFRLLGDRPALSSLLLGLHDEAVALHHVGVAGGFSEGARAQLLSDLAPRVVGLAGHPWERGFGLGPCPVGRLRAQDVPLASTPLEWDEVEAAVASGAEHRLMFDAAGVLERIDRRGDLFRPVLELEQTLPEA